MERLTALLSVHRRAVTRESEAAMFLHFPHNTAYTIAGRPLLRFFPPSSPFFVLHGAFILDGLFRPVAMAGASFGAIRSRLPGLLEPFYSRVSRNYHVLRGRSRLDPSLTATAGWSICVWR